MKKQPIRVETETINIAGTVEANCASITFENNSPGLGTIIYINNEPVYNGQILHHHVNLNEENTTRYTIKSNAAQFVLIVKRNLYK